jgi:uncharacterized protein YtpQ (UPF0354 family)
MNDAIKIVGRISEFKEDKKSEKSLLDRITEAKNETEIDYLLGVGKSYKKVHVGTIKKWIKAASAKMAELKYTPQ